MSISMTPQKNVVYTAPAPVEPPRVRFAGAMRNPAPQAKSHPVTEIASVKTRAPKEMPANADIPAQAETTSFSAIVLFDGGVALSDPVAAKKDGAAETNEREKRSETAPTDEQAEADDLVRHETTQQGAEKEEWDQQSPPDEPPNSHALSLDEDEASAMLSPAMTAFAQTLPKKLPALPLLPAPERPGQFQENARLTATGHRRCHRRIEDRCTLIPEDAQVCKGLCPLRFAITLCIQYQNGRDSDGLRPEVGFGFGEPLSISGAANFGERPPTFESTVAVLRPNSRARLQPKLPDILALFFREAACLPKRFQETGLDIFLVAPNPTGRSTAASFGMTLVRSPLPWPGRLRVEDLAGHHSLIPVTLHDLTAPLSGQGLEPLQMITRASHVGALDIGDVCQDMGSLLRASPAEYQKVAANQARLALIYASEFYGRPIPGGHGIF